MKKFVMALLMVALVGACSSRQDALEEDMEDYSGTTAMEGQSDDLPGGLGDTNINNGATAGGMNENTTGQTGMSDANILYKMSMTDTKEVNEGKLGVKKAKNAEVKKFAQLLINHHSKMLKDGQEVAQKINVTPVATVSDPDSAMSVATMQRLNNAAAGNFDNEFILVQIEGHQKALNDLNMMLNATQNADIKAAIQKAIPVVQSHLQQAQTIQTTLNGTSSGTTATGTTTTTQKKGE